MNRLLRFIFSFIFIYSGLVFGQTNQIDSLKSLIIKLDDKAKTRAQLELVVAHHKNKNYKQSIKLGLQIRDKARKLEKSELGKLNNTIATSYYFIQSFDSAKTHFALSNQQLNKLDKPRTLGLNYINLGGIAFYQNELDSAEKLFEKSISYFYLAGDSAMAIKAAINRSVVLGKLGKTIKQIEFLKSSIPKIPKHDWKSIMILEANIAGAFTTTSFNDSAMFYYLSALKTAKKHRDSTSQSYYLGNISQVFSNLNLVDKALEYARSAYRINKKLNRKSGIIYSLLAIGRTKNLAEENDSAKFFYWKALKQIGNSKNLAKSAILNNLGIIYFDQNNADSARYYFKLAEKENRETKTYSSLPLLFNRLAELALNENNLVLFNSLLDSTAKYTNTYGTYNQKSEYYRLLGISQLNGGNKQGALESFDKYLSYRDSNINEENTSFTAQLDKLYQTERKTAAIVELKQKNKIAELNLSKSALERKFLIISLLLSSLVVIAIFWALIIKRKGFSKLQIANKKVLNQNEQLEVLNKEIYHRAKNNLQTISSLLGLQQFELKDKAAKAVIADNQSRINTMAFINKRLFADNRIQKIDFIDFVKELIDELTYVFNVSESVCVLDSNVKSIMFEDKEAIALGLITNELLTNSFKYGLTNAQPKVTVSIQNTGSTFKLLIYDNGNGFAPNKQSNSFGEEMMAMMAEQLDAQIERKNLNGAWVAITFKIQ